jgi:FMN phosphatase YigB (HAD superfamily)
VEKPDPRIFEHALTPYGIAPHAALHLGDTFATDIAGGRAAGVRVALIDPYEHYVDRHLDVPRVPGAVEVAKAILTELG